jgi:periplasmic protein TonB
MKCKNRRLFRASSAEKAPRADNASIHDLLETRFDEKPIWIDLYENVRDSVFPQKLPPLELTSTPIPALDRMAVKANPWAIGTATVANTGLLALLILMGLRSTIHNLPQEPSDRSIQIKDFTLFAPPKEVSAGGGGGGGLNELTDPIAGRTPKQEMTPLAPPQIPMLNNPRLPIDPAIAVPLEIKLPDDLALPNIGVRNSPNVKLDSTGPGTGAGIGIGANGGDGPGKGTGYGPGLDRGIGGSVYTAGVGGVSNPIPLVSPEAEFSDEARRNKYQGVCMISIIVDAHGYPQNPRVIRALGMGLDEKALEAVQKYRFKPAMKGGKPVAATITVMVNFRLY